MSKKNIKFKIKYQISDTDSENKPKRQHTEQSNRLCRNEKE